MRPVYVWTPARQAASMKALEKANAAPPEKRNRFTLPRLLARFANLCLAHIKLGRPEAREMERLTRTMYNFLVRHYRQRAGFNSLKPDPHYKPPVLFRVGQMGARIREQYAGGPRVVPAVLRL